MPLDINDNNPLNISVKDELSRVFNYINNLKNLSKSDFELINNTIGDLNFEQLAPLDTEQKYQEFSILYPRFDKRSGVRLYLHESNMSCQNLQISKKRIDQLVHDKQIMFTSSYTKIAGGGSIGNPLLENMMGSELQILINRLDGTLAAITSKNINVLSNLFTDRIFINEFTNTVIEYKNIVDSNIVTQIPAELWRETMPVFAPKIYPDANISYLFVIILTHFVINNCI